MKVRCGLVLVLGHILRIFIYLFSSGESYVSDVNALCGGDIECGVLRVCFIPIMLWWVNFVVSFGIP